MQALFQAAQVIQFVKKPSLADMIAKRVDFLTCYQNAAYAADYQAFVQKVQAAEAQLGSTTRLTDAVARYLFKLMAYKDEYEVARLHTDKAFMDKIAAQFEGDYQRGAPPGAAPDRPAQRQGRAGQEALRPLDAHGLHLAGTLKGLRGGALDIFGKTQERAHRACADHRIPRLHRGAAGGSERQQSGAGGADRPHPRRDPRLWPREGAAPEGSASPSGTA